jgi:hypothetical protein
MGPYVVLLRSQELTTGPYPEPDEYSPDTHILHIHFNIIHQSMTRIPKGLFCSAFPTKLFTQLLTAGVQHMWDLGMSSTL